MLNSKQLRWLREGFTPASRETGKGRLSDMTSIEIADALEHTFGVKVTRRQIRHYVDALFTNSADLKRRTPGRPQKISIANAIAAAWGHELLQLTRRSASQIYAQSRCATNQAWPPVAKSTFHELLRATGEIPRKSSVSNPCDVMHRCHLRLHQIVLTKEPDRRYWVILAGYEQATGFVNVALYDLRVESTDSGPDTTSAARPKQLPGGQPTAWVVMRSDVRRVQLPIFALTDFVNDCRYRIGLPIQHVSVSSAVISDNKCAEHAREALLATTVEVFTVVGSSMPAHLFSTSLTQTAIKQRLTEYINRYNKALPSDELNMLKQEVTDGLELARSTLKIFDQRRNKKAMAAWRSVAALPASVTALPNHGAPKPKATKTLSQLSDKKMAVAVKLDAYFEQHSFHTGAIKPTTCRVHRLKATFHEHSAQTFLQKKPEASGQAG